LKVVLASFGTKNGALSTWQSLGGSAVLDTVSGWLLEHKGLQILAILTLFYHILDLFSSTIRAARYADSDGAHRFDLRGLERVEPCLTR
jgi:hypothetical protein